MTESRYIFNETVKKVFDSLVDPEIHTLSEIEIEPTVIRIETGSGNNIAYFEINQETKQIKVRYEDPSGEKNEWAGEFTKNVLDALTPIIIENPKFKTGGKRNKAKRTTRKRTLCKGTLRKGTIRKKTRRSYRK